jgi:murein tripeptide amidase MpaA
MMYLNVDEIESALIGLSNAHPTICQLVQLPNATVEGRVTHAVLLGTQPANAVDAYYLTGNVHAREWGSSDILVNMATDLCDAYATGTGIEYGRKYFSNAEVKALIEQINIIIYPCVNPDGRYYSQNTYALWRKNRNTADSGGVASKIGIDINRNQDFLWNLSTFAPGAQNPSFLGSNNPSDDVYHGHSPVSESETQNINYLHDTYKRIRWYVDVHSYSEDILFVWGDDEMQVNDTNKTFRNTAFDGQRGLVGDGYNEYIPDGDLSTLQALANAFTRSLAEVRGKAYVAKPGFSLYATSGTNDDYAYSRHYVDSSRAKSLAFTVEWGTTFQPLFPEMGEIIKDVSSGLIGLGLEALGIDSYIVTNRDTFSSYEVETTLAYPESFYVIYDGLAPSSLGVPGATPTITFLDAIGGNVINSIQGKITGVDLESPGALNTPQRVSFTVEVDFTDGSAFTAETRGVFAEASLAGMQDVAPIELVKQPNPYMVDGATSWLSTDVRVFQLRPGGKVDGSSNVTLGDPNADSNAPFAYIQGLLAELRGYKDNPAPPFENISQNEQISRLELSRTVGGVRVMNFAVAKVRYRAQTQDAAGVRVFFRTFNTMVSDLSYTTNPGANVQNYRRKADGTIPLLGLNSFFSGAGNQIVSVPYFAESRINSAAQSMTAQTDNWNLATLVHNGSNEGIQYFGCWLDFNQTDPQFPVQVPSGSDGPFSGRVPILQLVRGIHQCLVAEVRFQPGAVDPIPNGATPASSDRLAQRNLAIVESDNPGSAATHVVQHTLLVKPSPVIPKGTFALASIGEQGDPRTPYDELVIRWNDLLRDTTASFYSPAWNADEILALAATLRPGPQMLTKVDANTITCPVGDITYIPIPGRVQSPIPGLMTLQLPPSVRVGQQFRVDVQQHSGLTYLRTLTKRGQAEGKGPSRQDYTLSRRKVLGAFRMTTVVGSGEPLLRTLVRNLAVLRYIFQSIPTTDSWHPVFERYIRQLGDQVKGLGVDPTQVPPSADDPGIPGHGHDHGLNCYTGKVSEVIFDCFGNFEAFVLETCEKTHRFQSTEAAIGELVLRACRERLWISVRVREGRETHICEIIVRSGHTQGSCH